MNGESSSLFTTHYFNSAFQLSISISTYFDMNVKSQPNFPNSEVGLVGELVNSFEQ
jgi:hypothetical protein